MKNKTILITGGTDGIGKATALQLAQQGDTVTIVGRNVQKGEQAQRAITRATGATVTFVSVDMSLMSEVQRFAEDYLASYPTLDILVHSAGVMMSERVLTDEGFEMTFATQYLSRYWLTECLMPAINKSEDGKIFFVSSGRTGDGSLAYDNLNGEKKYSAIGALLNASRALSLYTFALISQRTNVEVYNYGPGLVQSSLGRNMPAIMNLYVKTIGQLFSIPVERAATEVTQLITQSYPAGFYQRGLKHIPSDQDFSSQQNHLLEVSRQLIQTHVRNITRVIA